MIRRYAVTDAAVHDSRKFNGLLHQGNTSHDVFGDSAYRSAANEATLKGRGFRSRIHVRAARGHPLSKAQAAANRAKSRIRARIEHVFGAQEIAPGGRLLRTIGIVRARIKIGLQNFVYNVRRLATLEPGGLTRSNWRADWLPLEGGARPPRRKKPAAGSKYAPLHKSVQRPIADFR